MVGPIGSPHRVSWPTLGPACVAPASMHLDVATVLGRRGPRRDGGIAAIVFAMLIVAAPIAWFVRG